MREKANPQLGGRRLGTNQQTRLRRWDQTRWDQTRWDQIIKACTRKKQVRKHEVDARAGVMLLPAIAALLRLKPSHQKRASCYV